MRRYLDSNFFRWFLVGCGTVSIDWVAFVGLYPRIGSVPLTNLLSGSMAISFNYFVHRNWTFESNQRHTRSGVRYAIALFFLYLMNTMLLKGFIGAGVVPGVAKLAAAVIQTPVSYLVLKHMVFKRDNGDRSK